MSKFSRLMMLVLSASVLSACGSVFDEAKYGVAFLQSQSSSSLLSMARKQMKLQAEGQALMMSALAEGREEDIEDEAALAAFGCSTSGGTIPLSGSISCSATFSSATGTCHGETVTMESGTFTSTSNFSGSSYTSYSMTSSFNSNVVVSSTAFSGSKSLVCNMSYTFTVTGSTYDFDMSCSDFSCTWDGDSIGCRELESGLEDFSCST